MSLSRCLCDPHRKQVWLQMGRAETGGAESGSHEAVDAGARFGGVDLRLRLENVEPADTDCTDAEFSSTISLDCSPAASICVVAFCKVNSGSRSRHSLMQ